MTPDRIDFNDLRLVRKYGSWVRVQVEFYDFLFKVGAQAHIKCFNQAALAEIAKDGWHDGGTVYDKAIGGIERTFASSEAAWAAFLKQEDEDGEA